MKMSRRTVAIVAGASAAIILVGTAAWASVTQTDHGPWYSVGTNDSDRANLSMQYHERAAGGIVAEEADVWFTDCSQYESHSGDLRRIVLRNQFGDVKWRADDIAMGPSCHLHFYGLEVAVGSANCADLYALVHPRVDNFPDPQDQSLHVEVCVS